MHNLQSEGQPFLSLSEIHVPEQAGYAVGRFLSSVLLAVGLKPGSKIGGFEIFFI